jgi:hypothetical protein
VMSKTISAVAILLAMRPDLALADVQGMAAQQNPATTSKMAMPESVNSDPLPVNQLLAADERDKTPAGESDMRLPPAPSAAPPERQRGGEIDPDLRTSPEAAHDLFQLLKKADPKQSKPK